MAESTIKSAKNIRWYMRYMHNKIGFIIVGLVIMYSLSGIVQTYRDTDLLKQVINHEQTLGPNLKEIELGAALKMKNFKVAKTENNILYFKDGTYDSGTGIVKFTTKELYPWIYALTELHKTNSKSIVHYFTIIFSVLLLFMSISAFWMFKPGTKAFSSGIYLTMAGIIAALLLLFMK
jgi:hypothetical protein